MGRAPIRRGKYYDQAHRDDAPPCTFCGAGRGEPCRYPSGRTCPYHESRRWGLAAMRADEIREARGV